MSQDAIILAKYDLCQQALEHCRKVLMSSRGMIDADSQWKRDQFYIESMRHMLMLETKLGEWRLKASALSDVKSAV